jgi:hypothetical protein
MSRTLTELHLSVVTDLWQQGEATVVEVPPMAPRCPLLL